MSGIEEETNPRGGQGSYTINLSALVISPSS